MCLLMAGTIYIYKGNKGSYCILWFGFMCMGACVHVCLSVCVQMRYVLLTGAFLKINKWINKYINNNIEQLSMSLFAIYIFFWLK